jgi:hypothetical protein
MRVLKAGLRLKSAVCSTEVMIIKSAAGEHDLRCGGIAMLATGEAAPAGAAADPALAKGTLVGKRYVDADEKFEILCTKGGDGTLSLDGVPMDVKQAKALPSSD